MVIYAAIKEKKDLDFIDASKWTQISRSQFDVMRSAAISSLTGP
jgi:hypothetical protein